MSFFALNFCFVLLAIGLDLILGDPRVKWHPIRLLGNGVNLLEKGLFKMGASGRFGGLVLVLVTLLLGVAVPWFTVEILRLFSLSNWWEAGFFLLLCTFLISFKDLIKHGSAVSLAIQAGEIEEVRFQTSMLVSRDTNQMNPTQASRATIESLAENMVDGVIAPLFYLFFLGPYGLFAFKCISTLDSMVGYQNERYNKFGWASAKLDDLLCWIPARIGWLLITLAAFVSKEMNGLAALKAGWLQHAFHASPNSGWSMAAVAGALRLRLGGPVVRGGVSKEEPWFGLDLESKEPAIGVEEIQQVSRLLLVTLLNTILLFAMFYLPFIFQ